MVNRRFFFIMLLLLIGLTAWIGIGQCEDRFPKPEFETSYQMPTTQHPLPRHALFQILDVAVLAATLLLAIFFIFKRRSRLGLYVLAIFSVIYFGFYRQGCVCPVGSIQNCFLSFTGDYLVPWVVLIFFALPLLIALFFGRVFCSSVCPLGALQELVIFKPIKLPKLLQHLLGLFPYLYLGLALLFTLTGTGFIICRFDPFVGLFRLSASTGMLVLGLGLLVLGMFVARPYCRFICPYGVLLGMFSFFSKKHLTITPKECVQCRLCENACPIDAIQKPSPKQQQPSRQTQLRRVGRLLALAPLIMAGLGFAFSQASDSLAHQNRTVTLAEKLHPDSIAAPNPQLEALYQQALKIRKQFSLGLWLLGIGLGLVIVVKLIAMMQRSQRETYEPDHFHCLSCGRCMEYCPVTQKESEEQS